MREIPVSGGFFAKVDDEDFERLSAFTWHADKQGPVVYAKTNLPRDGELRKSPRMHQLLVACAAGFRVDHRDGDGLNNQKLNLRQATIGQQRQNSAKRAISTSRFKGVRRQGERWCAEVKLNGVTVFREYADNQEDAATMYNFAASEAHGEFFRANI